MGDVWKARDTRLDRSVAIKLSKSKFSDRFHSEARAVAALNHPNICTLHDVGPDYLVMEYIEGAPLAGPLPPAKAFPLAVQILDALDAAHKKGIVHRDLKPGNILVTKQGVKLLDFGLATKAPSAVTPDAPTQTALDTGSEIAGTLQYMSPEQVQGKPVDARSDLFAFGAVLYELLAGRRAFTGENPAAIIAAILERDPAPLGTPFDKVIATCLAKDPDHRFQSATDTKRALEWALDAPAKKPAAPAKRWPLALAAVITCAALFYAFRPVPPKEPTPIIAVTRDGRSMGPVLSPDGKLIAFSSARANDNFDIYLQQSDGRAPVRITDHPEADINPVFSADGSRLYFASTRTPAGIYETATLGGDARLVVPNAQYAAESPDGKWLAYAIRESVWLRPVKGGEAKRIGTHGAWSVPLLWSPDSQRILLPSGVNSRVFDLRSATTEPLDRAVIAALRSRQMLIVGASQFLQWLPGDELLVTAPKGDASNLWRVPMGRRAGQPPIAVTVGTSRLVYHAHSAAGRIAFSSLLGAPGLFRLPVDLNAGRVTGPLRRQFESDIDSFNPDVTPDGRTLIYCSNRSGPGGVWLVDLASGQERQVATGEARDYGFSHSAISPDGKQIAAMFGGTVVVPADGGPVRRISKQSFRVRGWTPDSRLILVWSLIPTDPISVLDPATGTVTPILKSATQRLSEPRLSRDGKWIAFVAVDGPLYIAPFRGASEIPQSEWIEITRDATLPIWAPDSNSISFFSRAADAGNRPILFRQPLHPASKRPLGTPAILHRFGIVGLHTPISQSVPVAPDAIFLLIIDTPINIWSMDFPLTP